MDKTLESTEELVQEETHLPLKVWTQHAPSAWQNSLKEHGEMEFAGSMALEDLKKQASDDIDYDTINFKMVSATLARAKEDEADLVVFSNQQQDKIGVGVRNTTSGNFQLLTSHQQALLLIELLIEKHQQAGEKEEGKELLLVRSVITSDVLEMQASFNRIKCVNAYSGYEALVEAVEEKKGDFEVLAGVDEMNHVVFPGLSQEEGLCKAVQLFLEKASALKEEESSLLDFVNRLYTRYGFYQEKSFGVVKDAAGGKKEIEGIIRQFRNAKKMDFIDADVRQINDFQKGVYTNLLTDKKGKNDLPKENLLQVILEDNTKITLQPAEDYTKLYYHISVSTRILSRDGIDEAKAAANTQVMRLMGIITKV